MSETDPDELARQLEREGDELEERSDKLEGGVEETRQEWERKRSDPGVPGANPREEGPEEQPEDSPAPQAPPEDAEPSAAETAPEGAVGPPADSDEEESAEQN
jgi:hypothetical protein